MIALPTRREAAPANDEPKTTSGLTRIVRSLPFKFLLVIAWVVISPVLALGLVYGGQLVILGIWGILAGKVHWPVPVGVFSFVGTILLLTTGGMMGIVGLMRSLRHTPETSPSSVDLTKYFGLVGIITAISVVCLLATMGFDWRDEGPYVLPVVIALGIVVFDGLARLQNLSRLTSSPARRRWLAKACLFFISLGVVAAAGGLTWWLVVSL